MSLSPWCKELTHLKRPWFEKTLMLGKIEGERRGWQRMRWLNGITDLTGIVWACLGVGDGQGGLACWSPWGCRVWHDWATELMNWSDLPCLSSFATSYKIFKPFQRTSSLFHWFSFIVFQILILLIFAFIVFFLLLALSTFYLFGCLFLYIVQACFMDSRCAFLWYKHFNVHFPLGTTLTVLITWLLYFPF